MSPLGEWLRESRKRQLREDGKPWTQDQFLDALALATGWRLYRPNYSKYENAKTEPEPATVKKLVDFWTARGEPGPDLEPEPEPEPTPDLTAVLLAFSRELEAAREERTKLRAQVETLAETVDRLARGSLARGGTPGRGTPDARQESVE
jgi:hypothetical protein